MNWKDIGKKIFAKKEVEEYTPQREYIDRRHDALQRQMSFYEKKQQIPIMEKRIKELEKDVFGNGFKTDDKNNILKCPYYYKDGPRQGLGKRRGMFGDGGGNRPRQRPVRRGQFNRNRGGML